MRYLLYTSMKRRLNIDTLHSSAVSDPQLPCIFLSFKLKKRQKKIYNSIPICSQPVPIATEFSSISVDFYFNFSSTGLAPFFFSLCSHLISSIPKGWIVPSHYIVCIGFDVSRSKLFPDIYLCAPRLCNISSIEERTVFT